MSLYQENVNTLLKEYFPESFFTIKSLDSYDTSFRFKIGNNEESCVFVRFYDNYIFIETLEKCGIRGSETLHKIEQIGLRLDNILFITLEDGSSVEIYPETEYESGISIDLGVFKILTKGESWYNSLGYFSDNYAQELQINEDIIKMALPQFQEEVKWLNIDELKKKHTIEYYENEIRIYKANLSNEKSPMLISIFQNNIRDAQYKIDNLDHYLETQINKFLIAYETNLSNLLPLFPDIFLGESTDSMTIKRFYNKIMEIIIRDEPNEERCKWLSESLQFVRNSNILTYHRDDLRKYIRGNHGGAIKRKQKTHRKTKRVVKKVRNKTKVI